MKILKITCKPMEAGECYNKILEKFPNTHTVNHIPNYHIVSQKNDKVKGELPEWIHLLVWQKGGIIIKDEKHEVIKPPALNKNPKFNDLDSMIDKL